MRDNKHKKPRGMTLVKRVREERLPERGAVDVSFCYPGLDDKYRQPNGAPVWEQWPGEGEIEFLHFSIYRDMGPHRSLMGARAIALSMTREELDWLEKNYYKEFEKLRCTGGIHNRVRLRWGWAERTARFDEFNQERLGKIVNDPDLSREWQLKMAQEIREKALTKIRATPAHRLSTKDSIGLTDLAMRMERQLRGESDPNMEMLKAQETLDLGKLSVSELETIVNLFHKVQNDK